VILGETDYAAETVDLSFNLALGPVDPGFHALNGLLKQLDDTGKRTTWGFGGWPLGAVQEAPEATVLEGGRDFSFPVEAAVVNEDGKTIGTSRITLNSRAMRFSAGDKQVEPPPGSNGTVLFSGVDANDLTDNLQIRITRIAGKDAAESGYIRVTASRAQYEALLPWQTAWERGDRQARQTWRGDRRAYQFWGGDRWVYQFWEGDSQAYSVALQTWQGNREALTADMRAWERAAGSDYTTVFAYRNERGTITITSYKGSLRAVFIPAAIHGVPVTSIKYYAFEEKNLTWVTIPNGVTSIDHRAFSGNQLTGVTIPNGVTSIGSFAFSDNQLTSVTIPNSVTSIGAYAFSGNQLTGVTIPNSVTSIDDGAFSGNQLTGVTIPNSVRIIRDGAFSNNQLTSITIGANVRLSDTSESFSTDFDFYYARSRKKAGTYTRAGRTWTGPK
jgi:hypothetical protein